jgi:hypothetical protein
MLNYIANYYNFCRNNFFVYYTQQISAWLFGGAFAGALTMGNLTVSALSFVALLMCFPAHVFHRGLLKWSTLNYFALLMVSLACTCQTVVLAAVTVSGSSQVAGMVAAGLVGAFAGAYARIQLRREERELAEQMMVHWATSLEKQENASAKDDKSE